MAIIFGIYWMLGIALCLIAINAKPAMFLEKMKKYSDIQVVLVVVVTGLLIIPYLMFDAVKKIFVRKEKQE